MPISIWTQTINPKVLALCNLKQQQRLLMQSVSFPVEKYYFIMCDCLKPVVKVYTSTFLVGIIYNKKA